MHHDLCPLDCKGIIATKLNWNGHLATVGPLHSVWVARNPTGFAFVEFEDPCDAADAVRELDGRTLCGCCVRVELSNGEKRSRNRGPPPSWSRRPRDDYCRRSPAPHRRSPRRRSFSHSHSRSLSRDRRDHCQGREIISLLVRLPDLIDAPGQMIGSRTSGGEMYRKSHYI
ncbi:hypothetical protein JRQ81_015402 [Phrynocephalus forsythii]|uniref:RRM domain-containing protein n=1 Tax=Phrynocephalus forsythii TaxID=171643 RepID=A0A9Q0XTU0_9SAUR|nr:hypothetical protein JRQ81_015402 [Phrynocephalus forsythii]